MIAAPRFQSRLPSLAGLLPLVLDEGFRGSRRVADKREPEWLLVNSRKRYETRLNPGLQLWIHSACNVRAGKGFVQFGYDVIAVGDQNSRSTANLPEVSAEVVLEFLHADSFKRFLLHWAIVDTGSYIVNERGDTPNSVFGFSIVNFADTNLGGSEQLAIQAVAGLDLFNHNPVPACVGNFDRPNRLCQIRIKLLIY